MTESDAKLDLLPALDFVSRTELGAFALDCHKAKLCNRLIAHTESPVSTKTGLYIKLAKEQGIVVNHDRIFPHEPTNPKYVPYFKGDVILFSCADLKKCGLPPLLNELWHAITFGATVVAEGSLLRQEPTYEGELIAALYMSSVGFQCEEFPYPKDVIPFTDRRRYEEDNWPSYAVWKR